MSYKFNQRPLKFNGNYPEFPDGSGRAWPLGNHPRGKGARMVNEWWRGTLQQLATIERGRFSARPRNDPRFYGGEMPFLQTGDVSRASTWITSWQQTLNADGLQVSKVFPRGTILMSIAANVGDVGIINFDAACPDSVVAFTPRSGTDSKWLFHILKNSKDGLSALATQNAQSNLSLEKIKPFGVAVPPLPEQRKIAEILGAWDEAIEKTSWLIEAKERAHDALVTVLINDPDCEIQHLHEHLRQVSTRNRNGATERVLSVTNSAGFVLADDQFAHRVASTDLSNYKIVSRGEYAYNPSRINVGSIARLDAWDNGALSPMYVVFQVEPTLDSDFFQHWLSSAEARQRIRLAAQGSVRETISFDELGSILIPVPSLRRQQEIAHTLNQSNQDVHLLRELKKNYAQQKRGLMQKLLTGEWRVIC